MTFRASALFSLRGYQILSVGCLLLPSLSFSDVTLFGNNQTFSGHVNIAPEQGILAGTNLLHTFSQFNIGQNESVTFNGPSLVENILARVVGNEPSRIDGLLRSSIQNADLFLLNSNGVIFGAGSQIVVDGAFYVSTANSLKFTDGSNLLLTDGEDINISVASPQAFGFVANAGEVRFEGASINTVNAGTASNFDSLNVFAGEVKFKNSEVMAAQVPVQIVAVTNGSNIPLAGNQFAAASDFGDILISNDIQDFSSVDIDTSGAAAGLIRIVGGSMTMERAQVFSDTSGDIDGAGIILELQGELTLLEGSRITTATIRGKGRGGDIDVHADTITIDGSDSTIASNNRTTGGSGQMSLVADKIVLSNQGSISSLTRSSGDSGDINLAVGSLRVVTGAEIRGQTVASGDGANIDISASRSVVIGDKLGSQDDSSGIYVSSLSLIPPGGAAGSIQIDAPALEILSGTIDSRSVAGFSGPGGDISISADNFILADAGAISASTSSISRAGDITLSIGSFTHEGSITTSTEGGGRGDAGSIDVTASEYFLSGSLDAFTTTSGFAGDVFISADTMVIDGGRIDVRTESEGSAGTIIISVPTLELINGGEINSIVDRSGSGDGGTIILAGNELSLRDGGALTTSTAGTGQGGQIVFSLSGDVSIGGEGSTIASDTSGPARGGEIAGTALNFTLGDKGAITTLATAAGFAGDIYLKALASIDVSGGRIRTDSEQSGGGNITIDAVERLYLNKGELTASARGLKAGDDGGNVTIDPVFIILNDGRIVAQAIAGDGGVIQLQSDVFLSDRQSLISATSELGNDGEVRILAPDNGVTGVLGVLQVELDNSQPLLQLPCAASALSDRSSLIYNSGVPEVSAPDDLPFARLAGCRAR